MRQLVIALFLASLAVGACNRGPDTASGTATRIAQPGAETVPTTGAAEPAHDRTALEAAVAKTSVREVTIPAGTELAIVLDSSVGSDTSHVEEPVRAHLSRAVTVESQSVLAEGSSVSGVVTDAKRSGKVKGLAHVAVRFDTLVPRGADDRYRIETVAVGRTAADTKKKDALEIGGGAVGGAIIGAIVGGKKGAAIGTAAGAGAGTGVVLSTRGKEIHLPAGSALRLRLSQPLTITVRG